MVSFFTSANRFDTDDLDDFEEPKEPKERPEGGFLLAFVKRAFRVYFGFLLWVILIGWIIVGYMNIGSMLAYVFDSVFLGKLVGLIVGTVVGMLTIIAFGGVIAMLLAIEKNTAKTEENTAEMLSVLKKNTKGDDTFERRVT
jgi:F0F1-type ATP synthase assembly protein I